MKTIFLYGISDADQAYRVLRYEYIPEDSISISTIKYCASDMMIRYPNVKHVYAVDQRPGLRRDFMTAFKRNSVESWAIFKDLLERDGWKVI